MDTKKKTINIDLKQFGMVFALIAIFLIFYIMTGKNASPANITNLISQNSYVVILATGMLLCVLTGNIDLGVGSYVALVGGVVAMLVVDNGMNTYLAFLVGLLVGLVIGLFNAFFIAYLGIPPFVVTLASMLMGRGLTYTILKAQTKGPLPSDYTYWGAGFLPTIKLDIAGKPMDLICIILAVVITVAILFFETKSAATRRKYNFAQYPIWQTAIKDIVILFIVWFFLIKLSQNNGIPFVLVIMAILVGIYSFITSNTVAGRQIYALGGNAKAARLSGIDTRKVFFWVYVNMGVLSALAGIVLSARNAAATPKAGDGFELDAIASCYIGGAAAAGGVGTIIGAVVGAFVMGVLNNGMTMAGWSTDIQKIVKGIVLLGAVTFDVLSQKKKG